MKAARILLLIGAALVLGPVNYSIAAKEAIKRDGETIYLMLVPIDPRSIMQGDYMALRFELAQAILATRYGDNAAVSPFDEGKKDYAPLVVDRQRIARLAKEGEAGTLRLRYRIRHGQPWIGTNALFFEEGSGERYARASYGEFKLDPDSGEAVLIGLRGSNLQPL